MENLQGIKIPEEVIREILKFVPKRDWHNIACANKFLYNLICNSEKSFDKEVVINEVILNDISLMQSIWNSKRKFSKVKLVIGLNSDTLRRVKELLEIHRENILETNIIDTALNSNLQAIVLRQFLNEFENLKILRINARKLKILCWGNEMLKLNNLEEIYLDIKEADLGRFLLAFYPNSIKKLSILSHIDGISDFLLYQKSIKELEISEHYHNENIFKHLSLDIIRFKFRKYKVRKIVLNLIKQQHGLKEIYYDTKISSDESDSSDDDEEEEDSSVSQSILDATSKLENLERLDFYETYENYDGMHKLSNLKNLKEIHFFLYEIEENHGLNLSEIKFKNLDRAKIIGNLVEEDALNNIGLNWSGLKHLTIEEPLLSLNTILFALPHLETLIVFERLVEHKFFNDETIEKFRYNYDGFIYPNLKNLFIDAPFKISGDLLDALPNLEKLHVVTSFTKYSLGMLEKLSHYPNLKSLSLNFKINTPIIHITEEIKLVKYFYRKLEYLALTIKNKSKSNFNERLKELLDLTVMKLDVEEFEDDSGEVLEITKI